MEGPVAPPRQNGELVFEAPWESRAFGMAVALHDSGAYDWDVFSNHLARQIAMRDAGADSRHVLPAALNTESRYYEAWLSALQDLLVERGFLSMHEVEEMTAVVASGVLDHS
jgi:nitrile hydratase accessory protein